MDGPGIVAEVTAEVENVVGQGGDTAADVVEAVGETVVVLEGVGVGLEHEVAGVEVGLMEEVPVVAVDADEEAGAEVGEVLQALGDAVGLVPVLVAGTGDEMEAVAGTEVLEDGAPKDDVVAVLDVDGCPATEHFGVEHEAACRLAEVFLL